MNKLSARDFSMVAALLVIFLAFALIVPEGKFVSSYSLTQFSIKIAITATLALGMLLVLLPGQIDLSAGSGVALIGGISAVLINQHYLPAPLAMLIGLAVAVVLWFLMGVLIAHQRVPAFIITLGCMLLFRGIFQKVINNGNVPVQHGDVGNLLSSLSSYRFSPATGYLMLAVVTTALVFSMWRARQQRIKHGFEVDDLELFFLKAFVAFQALLLVVVVVNGYRGMPLALAVFGVIAVAVHVLTTQTPFGRYLYAIGGNREAAIVSGVPVNKIIIGAYMILGAIVAIVGFMQTAYQSSSSGTVGRDMELDAIAACVIGGTSLTGGKGNVLGVIVGALIMATIISGMNLLPLEDSENDKLLVRGAVLILAVWIDVRLARKS
jgi:D-xylose transport system permease protein